MRVFIVEDDRRVRESLTVLLDGEGDMTVAGTAGSVEEALEAIEGARPDVVLCDLGLPGKSGIDLIRTLRSCGASPEILAYTVFEDRDVVFGALKAGANGYVLKGSTPRQLIEALTSLNEGGAPMSPRIARAVISDFHESREPDPELTQRERQVLSAVDQGFSYKEIASELGVTRNTVHGYVKTMYDKLHSRGRREALEAARRKGLL